MIFRALSDHFAYHPNEVLWNTSQPANQTARKNQTNQTQAGNTTTGNGAAAGNGHDSPGQPAPCLPALALIPLAQLALLAGGMKTDLGYFSANPP
jgi:hypothetical protein